MADPYTDLSSSSTTNLSSVSTSDKIRITGNTTISSFGTAAAGERKLLRFADKLILSYHSSNMILPGKRNIVTQPDDGAVAVSLGSGSWIIALYTRAKVSLLESDWYSNWSDAKAAAYGADAPVVAPMTTNMGFHGAHNRRGLSTGHILVSNSAADFASDPDAFVGILADELYVGNNQDSPDNFQEMRGLSYTIRYYRKTPDQPTLGWDSIPVTGSTVVAPDNDQEIIGNMKAVVGEVHFQKPLQGTYHVRKSYNLQATSFIDENVTVGEWYGCVIGTPGHNSANGGFIGKGFGVYVQNITGGGVSITDAAAVRIDGTGNAGRIWWNSTWITQDSSGKLEMSLNNSGLVLKNAKTSTSATTGSVNLPAKPSGFLSVFIGGIERKLPYYEA